MSATVHSTGLGNAYGELTFEQEGDEFFVCLDCCISPGIKKKVSREFFDACLTEFADDIFLQQQSWAKWKEGR